MHILATRLLIGSYVGILITIVGGFVLYPDLFFDHPHRGLSYYGNHFPTVIPYVTGLAISIICTLAAVRHMPKAPRHIAQLRYLLVLIAAGLGSLLMTPEEVNSFFYWAHALATIFLFATAGGTALWITGHGGFRQLDVILIGTLMIGVVLSLLSAPYVRVLGLLSLGQVLALNGGTLLIVRAGMRWLRAIPRGQRIITE